MTIFDLAYEVDHEKLYNIFLNPALVIDTAKTEVSADTQINLFVHLKRGALDKVDTTVYELVKLVGYLRKDVKVESTITKTHSSFSSDNCDKGVTFVGTGRVQMPQMVREMSAIDPSKDEFTSKHSMEWKFIFLDQRAPPIIGYMPFEVLGTSGYDYYHFDDLDSIITCHEELMQKGEGKSCYYRFLTKGQQWIWLQSEFYISYHSVNSKPDYVVCTHKVVSYSDVMRNNKLSSSSNRATAKSPTATVTLKDLDCLTAVVSGCVTGTTGLDVCGIEKQQATTTTKSPDIDSSLVYQQRGMKSSAYGNMSALSTSSTIKRKRYSRGNDSEYTSDSSSSRQSLLTHLSTQSRTRHSLSSHLHQVQQQQQQPISSHSQQSHHHLQQQQQLQSHSHSKLSKMSQQTIGLQLVSSPPAQFTQPSYPMRNPQLVGHTFLEPQQYPAAIPVQPVIAPFPMTSVLPSMNNTSDIFSGVMMTPTQTQIQDQLQRKHDELQKMIFQQQDELRRVSEQLLMARYTIIPTYNATNNSRHFQLGGNSMEHQQTQPQFANYNFAMPDQLQNSHHEPQVQHNHQHTQHQQHQQHQQHLQQQQQQQQQQQHQLQSTQSLLLSRNLPVPELDQFGHEDIDAFLSAEALQPTLVLPSPSPTAMNSQQQLQPQQQQQPINSHGLGSQHDDSLLSYMQLPTDPTPNLHFQIGISDDGPESRCDETGSQNRFMSYQAQSNQLPNDLEILPYQMSQEQSQILFNSSNTPGPSQ